MECNLELGLLTSSTSVSSSTTDVNTFSTGSNGESSRQEQMTIFYNGRICVCDLTEIQARSIIALASKKSADEMMCRSFPTVGTNPMLSPKLQSQNSYAQNGSLSMKRSLRQFLEKRKHRVQSASPYHR